MGQSQSKRSPPKIRDKLNVKRVSTEQGFIVAMVEDGNNVTDHKSQRDLAHVQQPRVVNHILVQKTAQQPPMSREHSEMTELLAPGGGVAN